MKKLFFIAAIAGAALVSCTKNELAPSVTEQQVISFDTPVIGAATKVDLLSTYPTETHFGVFGLYYEGDWTGYDYGVSYMDNVEVARVAPAGTDTDGGWTANGYYWPKNNASTLTFAAYSPYMATGVSHDETGIHFTNYVVDNANVDLLFSDRAYSQKKSNQVVNNSVYYGVNITFNHALSAILFQAKAAVGLTGNSDKPNYKFVITKIEVLNADSKGTFNQNLTDDAYGPITPGASTSDWNTSIPKDYVAYTGSGITVDSTTPISAFGTGTDNSGKADLILLPQALNDVSVRVTYNLRHDGMPAGKYIENNVVSANLSYDDADDSKDVTSWLRGKRYIYTLTLDLDKIYFAPNMAGWTDVEVPASSL